MAKISPTENADSNLSEDPRNPELFGIRRGKPAEITARSRTEENGR